MIFTNTKAERFTHDGFNRFIGYVDTNGYDKLIKIFQTVVNTGIQYKTADNYNSDGEIIGKSVYYAKGFVDEGVKVIVRLYTGLKAGIVYFSDAWGELFG